MMFVALVENKQLQYYTDIHNLQFDQVLVLVDTSKVHNQRKLTQDFSQSLWL